uniref:Uncharacterized protein n=1 Tax=Arundo donax TaxID=35708 RepID=A0A0A9GFX6_ARUDO
MCLTQFINGIFHDGETLSLDSQIFSSSISAFFCRQDSSSGLTQIAV